jgi:hypothetical protein
MKRKDEKQQGCGCKARVQNAVGNMVEQGTKPTRAEHNHKKGEVTEAFESAGHKTNQKSSTTAKKK